MIGSVVEDCTRATSCGESTSDAIIQDAPTDWMRPPKFEAMLAIQTARKVDICCGDGVKFPANSGEVLVIPLRCGPRAPTHNPAEKFWKFSLRRRRTPDPQGHYNKLPGQNRP